MNARDGEPQKQIEQNTGRKTNQNTRCCRSLGQDADQKRAQWQAWQQEAERLSETILARREGKTLDLDRLWDEVRAEQEARDDGVLGR